MTEESLRALDEQRKALDLHCLAKIETINALIKTAESAMDKRVRDLETAHAVSEARGRWVNTSLTVGVSIVISLVTAYWMTPK